MSSFIQYKRNEFGLHGFFNGYILGIVGSSEDGYTGVIFNRATNELAHNTGNVECEADVQLLFSLWLREHADYNPLLPIFDYLTEPLRFMEASPDDN